MADSLEDRLYAAGKDGEFRTAVEAFQDSEMNRSDQQILYDELTRLGAGPEEADEFVDMLLG